MPGVEEPVGGRWGGRSGGCVPRSGTASNANQRKRTVSFSLNSRCSKPSPLVCTPRGLWGKQTMRRILAAIVLLGLAASCGCITADDRAAVG